MYIMYGLRKINKTRQTYSIVFSFYNIPIRSMWAFKGNYFTNI